MMGSQAEQINERFHAIRRKLSEQNYKETFGAESLDLVERLYADLLKSSSSCQALQEEATRLTSDLMLISPQIHTLRKENSQIKTENSQLHLDNIKLQEDLRDANEQAQRRMRQLNDDLTAQTLLNKAYEEEMRKKDQVADALRDAYDGVVDPALRTRTLTASSMRISSRLPAADNSGVPVDKAWAEVKAKGQGPTITSDEATVSLLSSHLEEAQQHILGIMQENQRLKGMLSSREQELSRVGRLLATSSSPAAQAHAPASASASSAMLVDTGNQHLLSQLNSQVDFLNRQLAMREAQIAQMQLRAAAAASHGERAEDMQMKDMRRLVDENRALGDRVRALEKKLLSVSASSPRAGTASGSHSPVPTPRSPRPPSDLLGSSEWKAYAADVPLSPVRSSYDASAALQQQVSALTEQNAQLQKQLQLAQLQSVSSSAVPPPPPVPSVTKSATTATVLPGRGGMRGTIIPKRTSSVQGDSMLIKDLNKEVEETRKQNKQLMKRIMDLEAQVARVADSKSSTGNVDLNKALQDVASLQEALRGKDDLLFHANKQYDQLQLAHAQSVEELDAKTQDIQQLQSDQDELLAQLRSLTDDYEELQSADHTLEGLLQQQRTEQPNESDGHELMDEIKQLRELVSAKDRQLTNSTAELDRLRQRLSVVSTASSLSAAEHAPPSSTSSPQPVDEAELALYKSRYASLQAEFVKLSAAHEQEGQVHQQQEQRAAFVAAEHSKLKTSFTALQEKHFKLEMQHADLQHFYEQEKMKRLSLEDTLRKLQQQSVNDEHTLQQLQDLVTSLQQTGTLHVNQLKLNEKSLFHLQSTLQAKADEIAALKAAVEEEQQTTQRYKQQVVDLDSKLDELHDALQLAEEKGHQYEAQLAQQATALTTSQGVVASYTRKVEKYKTELSAKLSAIALLDNKCLQLEEANRNMKHDLQRKAVNLTSNNEDLSLMTAENQKLTNELMIVSGELSRAKTVNQQQMAALQQLQEEQHILQIDHRSLTAHYQALSKDYKQLEEDVKLMVNQHAESASMTASLQKQLEVCKEQLAAQAAAMQGVGADRSATQGQLLHMNEVAVNLQRKLESVEADNRRLIQDVYGLKQTNALLNDRLSSLMQRSSTAQDNNAALSNRQTALERERDGLRGWLEAERQRTTELNQLLSVVRMESATKDIHIARLQSEVTSLSTTQAATGSPETQKQG